MGGKRKEILPDAAAKERQIRNISKLTLPRQTL